MKIKKSRISKKEIRQMIDAGWTERREKVEKQRKKNNAQVREWAMKGGGGHENELHTTTVKRFQQHFAQREVRDM